jgi:hypothetical protein
MAGVLVTLYITDSAAFWVGVTELSKNSDRETNMNMNPSIFPLIHWKI